MAAEYPQVSEIVGSPVEPEAEVPVAFKQFAATLRPTIARDAQGRPIGVSGAGQANEIWLNFLRQHHRFEKRSMSDWHALIAEYGKQPAHPAGMI